MRIEPGNHSRPGIFSLPCDAREQFFKIAAHDTVTVLLSGETGTGKTFLALKLHEASPRSQQAFVEVDCASISTNLAESQLFGHMRGAFTGAIQNFPGFVRAADHGTLFLDEIGELDLPLQAKLLKVIDERRFTPLGADAPVCVDIRLIAATNRNLPAMVASGAFRDDLFQRLHQACITLRPLRERIPEIRAIAIQRLYEWNLENNETKVLSEDAFRSLERYSWPGNIRELRNAIVRAALVSRYEVVGGADLSASLRNTAAQPRILPTLFPLRQRQRVQSIGDGFSLKRHLASIELKYVRRALKSSSGNIEQAAKILGIKGETLRKALRQRMKGKLETPKSDDSSNEKVPEEDA
jgi:transcriptional regulator with PAS, ATPase and Fis domain